MQVDVEIQFCSQQLSELVSVKGAQVCAQGGGYLIPHLKDICNVMDRLVVLGNLAFAWYSTGTLWKYRK